MNLKTVEQVKTSHLNVKADIWKGIVVVIAAYNEERFIGSVVLKTRKWADQVCVVDDGSTDATAEIAEAAGATVIRHEKNMGKGVALNTGLKYAQRFNPEIIITLDGDGQHLPEEMNTMAGPIMDGTADIVVGSRYIEKRSQVPLHRILGHIFFNYMTGSASGVHLSDSQSGFRAFSNRAYNCLRFNSTGFSVESEMQFLAHEQKLRVTEVPITVRYQDKPKRSVILHGLIVLNGVLHLVGQYRPLFFFGLAGLVLILIGAALAIRLVNIYQQQAVLPLELTLFTIILELLGMMSLFTGIVLHSVRGLLLNLVHPNGDDDARTME